MDLTCEALVHIEIIIATKATAIMTVVVMAKRAARRNHRIL